MSTVLASAEVVQSYRERGFSDEDILNMCVTGEKLRKPRGFPKNAEKYRQVVELRAQGLTYQQVGDPAQSVTGAHQTNPCRRRIRACRPSMLWE